MARNKQSGKGQREIQGNQKASLKEVAEQKGPRESNEESAERACPW